MSNNPTEAIKKRFPQWADQYDYLCNLIGQRSPRIFIPGPRDFEKSLFLLDLMTQHGPRIAYIRISELFWNRSELFEKICFQLSTPASTTTSLYSRYGANMGMFNLPKSRRAVGICPSTAVFVEKMKEIVSKAGPSERAYILLEDVDKLDIKVFGENILAIFLRLEEMISMPIGVIMTASCDWASVQPEFPVQSPILVPLPTAYKVDLITSLKESDICLPQPTQLRILELENTWAERATSYRNTRDLHDIFVSLIVDALRLPFPTKRELHIVSRILFPRYIEPVLKALESSSPLPSVVELFTKLRPLLRIAVQTPSLMFLEEELDKLETGTSLHTSMDFPLICKYLLISAWIASRNPNIDAEIKDRRRRRKSAKSEASRLEEEAFAPPSSWRLDKLLSILEHVLTGNEEEEDGRADRALMGASEEKKIAALFSSSSNATSSSEPSKMQVDATTDTKSTDMPTEPDVWTAVEENTKLEFSLNELDEVVLEWDNEKGSDPSYFDFVPDSTHFESAELFPLLWEANKGNAGQLEILAQIAIMEQIGLFIRVAASTSKTVRARSEYKCGYDARFVASIANSINFPLWGFV